MRYANFFRQPASDEQLTSYISRQDLRQSSSITPALLLAPADLLLKQWKEMSDSDRLLDAALVVYPACVFGYLGIKGAYSSMSYTDSLSDTVRRSPSALELEHVPNSLANARRLATI